MMKNIIKIYCAIVFAGLMVIGVSSCGAVKKMYGISDIEVLLTPSNQSVPNTFRNLDKTLGLIVTSRVGNEDIYDDSNLSSFRRKALPHYTFVPQIKTFAEDASRAYLQKMHFDIESSADYMLKIEITNFKMIWTDNSHVACTVSLNYQLNNNAGETIIPATSVTSKINLGQTEDFGVGLGRAYASALDKINWNEIAKYLSIADSPKKEKNSKVKGEGDTALEHTVIRWYITSSPQGADVTWRVISSTPDVSNTNSSYVGTTPYETTESFDIKGLSYNNSGNIQIEVSCEKPGYITQRKRFNLQQVIDQKEISAKFNLIKE